MGAINVFIKARDLEHSNDVYVDMLSEYTGKPREEVYEDVGRKRYFTPEQAVEYGLIDKVVQSAKDEVISESKDYDAILRMAQAQQQQREYRSYARPVPGAGARAYL